MDIFAGISSLTIIILLRHYSIGMFQFIREPQLTKLLIYNASEFVLEVLYSVVVPLIMRSHSKYEFYYPIKSGAVFIKKYVLQFTTVVALAYPLAFLCFTQFIEADVTC